MDWRKKWVVSPVHHSKAGRRRVDRYSLTELIGILGMKLLKLPIDHMMWRRNNHRMKMSKMKLRLVCNRNCMLWLDVIVIVVESTYRVGLGFNKGVRTVGRLGWFLQMSVIFGNHLVILIRVPAVVEVDKGSIDGLDNQAILVFPKVLFSLMRKLVWGIHGDVAFLDISSLVWVVEFLCGFGVEILIFKDGFHGFQLFFHLPQMLRSDFIHLAQFVVCSQLRALIRAKQFRYWTHKIWAMEMILA
jgi:hypothetical protein